MERLAGAEDGAFDQRGVLLRVLEAGDGAVAEVDVGGEDGDGGGVVGEEDLLVGVRGGDGDVEAGVKGVGGGGEVQVREFQRRHGEGGVVGAVEEVEHRAADADQEEEDQNGEDQPEEEGAAAPALAPAPVVGLRAVGGACGAVKLSLSRRERWVGGGAVNRGGLGRWVHPVCHGCVVLLFCLVK